MYIFLVHVFIKEGRKKNVVNFLWYLKETCKFHAI